MAKIKLPFSKLRQWWHRQQHGDRYVVMAAIPEADGWRPIELIGTAKTRPAAEVLWNDYERHRKKIVHAQRYVQYIRWGKR